MRNFAIGKHKVGPEEACYVIAEIGHNHQGKLDMALEMIDKAAKCGVNAVKFQKRDIEQLYTDAFLNEPYTGKNSFGETYGAHRKVLEFGFEEMAACKARARERNLDFIITPFDLPSLDFCARLGVDAYKIASGDLTNHPLIEAIARLGKPVIISCGASTLNETRETHDLLETAACQFVLLYAVSSYPATPSNLNLRRILDLKKLFPDTPIGYSGHDIGIEATKVARSLGAVVIEKHFTLDHQLKGTDQSFSLDAAEMAELVTELRKIDLAMGCSYGDADTLNSYELAARRKMGKGIYANRPIEAGTCLTEDHLAIKSPGNALAPNQIESILGRKTNRPIPEGAPIDLKDLAKNTLHGQSDI